MIRRLAEYRYEGSRNIAQEISIEPYRGTVDYPTKSQFREN